MKLTFEVNNHDNNPQKNLKAYLYEVTGKSKAKYQEGPLLAEGTTDKEGKVTFNFRKTTKTKKVAAIFKRKGQTKVLAQKAKVLATLDAAKLITIKMPKEILINTDIAPDISVVPGVVIDGIGSVIGSVEVPVNINNIITKNFAKKKILKANGLLRAQEIMKPKNLGNMSLISKGGEPDLVLTDARNDGLKRLQDQKNSRRGIIVRKNDKFSKKELKDFIKEFGDKPQKIREFLMEANVTESRRTDDLLSECYKNKHLKDFEASISENAEGGGGSTVTAVNSMSIDELSSVEDRVDKIVSEVQQNSLLKRPDINDVNQSLKDNQLSNGPADTTAYYDYKSLQVAWSDVWDSVFDVEASETIASLYEEVFATVAEEDAEADLSEINSLDKFLSYISMVEEAHSEPLFYMPPAISNWLPLANSYIGHISQKNLVYLEFLLEIDVIAKRLTSSSDKDKMPNEIKEITEIWREEWLPSLTMNQMAEQEWAINEAKRFLNQIEKNASSDSFNRVRDMIESLKRYIVEPYKFDIFVPNSYNFGVLTTYRQKWIPKGFQAGELISTIPLSPGERRTFEVNIIDKSEESKNDTLSKSISDNRESSSTSRMTSQIVDKAMSSMKGGISAGMSTEESMGENVVGSFSVDTSFASDQGSDSSRTKEGVKETVRKSAQEYKDERTVEINKTSSREVTQTSMTEISNPNNELTVTYLFYELQQRFRVSEKLYDVTPTIMIAFEVPKPNEITESWLIRHSWIIKKGILDRTLLPVLLSLDKSFTGDEVSVEIKKRQWFAQLDVVDQLKRNMAVNVRELNEGQQDLLDSMQRDSDKIPNRVKKLIKQKMKDDLASEDEYNTALQALEWANEDIANSTAELRMASTALERATESYVGALEKSMNRKVSIDSLKAHIKQNILYYMQLIWMHENADQRYMRLYDLEIHWPENDGKVTFREALSNFTDITDTRIASLDRPIIGNVLMPTPTIKDEKRSLHQVAKLDRILGFKGNYAVFALKEDNALTDYMAQDFLDTEFGVYDPDPDGEVFTADEALDLAHCAWQNPDLTSADKKKIKDWLVESISKSNRRGQDIIIPSGELFIEALPGKHTLLEDFKLRHREADAKKASAEAQIAQIEALRRAQLLKEGDYSDPSVDKSVHIVGNSDSIIVDTE